MSPRLGLALGGASPQQRARWAVRDWLAAGRRDWRIARTGELQGRGCPGSSGQAVFQFDLEGRPEAPGKVVAKCLHRGHSLQTACRQAAVHRALLLRDGGCLTVPRALFVDAAHGVLLQERARGRSLADFSASELPALAAALECCGRALRELHELPLDVLGPARPAFAAGPASTDIPTQLATLLCPAPMTLAARSPQLRRQVLQVTQDLVACEARCDRVPDVPLHGDVHPRQLFVDDERVALIDWDRCGPGDPALDLANLLMHVELRWPAHAPALQLRLLEGWWSVAAPALQRGAERVSLAQRIHLYRAFHSLRRACKAWRVAAGDDAGDDAIAAPPLAPSDLHAVALCLDAAELHLDACRRSVAGNESPSLHRPAAGLQP